MMGRRQVRVEKQAVEGNNPHRGHRYKSDGVMALCQGEPWDGTLFLG
jgi:hypothetical protein